MRGRLPIVTGRQDLLQGRNAGTEGVAIVIDQFTEPSDQRFGLFVYQVKVHRPDIGPLSRSR